jgi:hypothetical protein
VKSPAPRHAATWLATQQPGVTSGACAAAGAPRDREAIVTLLALMLRGLLTGAPRAGANA